MANAWDREYERRLVPWWIFGPLGDCCVVVGDSLSLPIAQKITLLNCHFEFKGVIANKHVQACISNNYGTAVVLLCVQPWLLRTQSVRSLWQVAKYGGVLNTP